MGNGDTARLRTDEPGLLADVSDLIDAVFEEDGGIGIDIGMDTQFTADLGMDSVDLVALSTRLQDRYGARVNFAEFIADFDLDEIIELSVGQLVRHLARSFADPGES